MSVRFHTFKILRILANSSGPFIIVYFEIPSNFDPRSLLLDFIPTWKWSLNYMLGWRSTEIQAKVFSSQPPIDLIYFLCTFIFSPKKYYAPPQRVNNDWFLFQSTHQVSALLSRRLLLPAADDASINMTIINFHITW